LRTMEGHAAVVRNGHHPERPIQTGVGPVNVRIPKVRSKDGTPVTFRSALVPPYVRKTMTLEAALPWLYLKGISTSEMGMKWSCFLGQVCGFAKMYLFSVHAAFCINASPKYTLSGVRLSSAV
jgi:putative transposase